MIGVRANVFAIHSWLDASACRRMEDLLRSADPDLAHYSILPERALGGTFMEVRRNIEQRIQFATAVLVMNTPDLYQRSTAKFEMETAVRMEKRIVVVQPYGEFQLPVPAALDGNVYRYATWRSDVVGRAIRGEYPEDGRVFDIAEVADRRVLVGLLARGIALASFALIVNDVQNIKQLHNELAARGVELRWTRGDTDTVVGHALAGAAIAGLLGALSGDTKTALLLAAAGAAVGAAVGVHRVYNACLLDHRTFRTLVVEPA